MNIANVRDRLDLTQEELADALEIPVRTIQNWEQHRRWPSGPAKKLLSIFKKHPELFIERLDTEESDESIEPPRVKRDFRRDRALRVRFRRSE